MAGYNLFDFMDRSKQQYRARKPPGGDTHDIFDLEERQRIQQKDMVCVYEDKGNKETAAKELVKKHRETEDVLTPKENIIHSLRRSLSDCKLKLREFKRTPPLAVGKENIGIYDKLLPLKDLVQELNNIPIGHSDDENEESVAIEKLENRNPITGIGVERDSAQENLKENVKDAKKEATPEIKKSRRPCIRIRQPPGGKSSIIF